MEFHLFKKERALLRGVMPAKLQAALRRRLRARYLVWSAREYRRWLALRMPERKGRYMGRLEPGLLSILTPVWDGTPLEYFRELAQSIMEQNSEGAAEWVILNNGCQDRNILNYLAGLKRHAWIKVVTSSSNAGIIGGLHLCLQAANGRYVLPVDSDDLLYPDCLQIVTWWVRKSGYPALLYSDEDKVIGDTAVQPYLKPDFDPVLLLNSAYIAHLGVIDRTLALKYGAYTDKNTEGSPDWDLFVRFLVAGERTAHIPEVIYSWRMHPESTSDDADSKPYIHSSQKAVLQRYLDTTGLADKSAIEYCPFVRGSADFWLRRQPLNPWPALVVSIKTGITPVPLKLDYPEMPTLSVEQSCSLTELAELVANNMKAADDLICLVSDDLQIERADWLWDAVGLFERHPDTAMVGGHIRTSGEITSAAGFVLGFGSPPVGCPDKGRPAQDPGYFTQMWKQRSVSFVSSQFCVVRAGFLRELAGTVPKFASLALLGPWAGAHALRTGQRIVYSPYVRGVSNFDWSGLAKEPELLEFVKRYSDLLPDCRYYPAALSLQEGQSYQLVTKS